jgi:hypothetical protein
MQLRLLETVVQVSSEKNSTLILPFPVELLRFLDAHTPKQAAAPAAPAAPVAPAPEPEAVEAKPEPNGHVTPAPRTPGDAALPTAD